MRFLMKNDPIKNFRELIERSRRLMAQDAQQGPRGLSGGDPKISAPFNVQHNTPDPQAPNQGNPAEQQYQFRKVNVAGRSPSEILGSLPDAPNLDNNNAPSVQNNVQGMRPDPAPGIQPQPAGPQGGVPGANAQSKIQQTIAKIQQSGVPTTPNPERGEVGRLATENQGKVRGVAGNGWPPGTGRGGR
jgi:hypothetical protein